MSLFGKGRATSSLHALRRKVTVEALAGLQPILLLQILVGLSQSLSGEIAQRQALARTLLLDGQQRLCKLLDAAPRLNLPVERVLEICRSGDAGDADRTPEENAVQALLEMCLGLILQWLDKDSHWPYTSMWLSIRQPVLSSAILSLSSSFFSSHPHRTRACPITPLA